RVAGIQMSCSEDPRKNLLRTLDLLQIAAGMEARIVCLQELVHLPWFPRTSSPSHFDHAETLDGETVARLREAARRHGLVLVCPIFEREGEGEFYNTAVVIDQNGEVLGKYRKNHVPYFPFYEERFYFKPGNLGFPVFKTDFATLGVQISWDIFFPEGARIMALGGAQVIFAPTAGAFLESCGKWETVLRAHAITNGLYIFRVNRVGGTDELSFYGRSFCVDPHGEFLTPPSGDHDGVVLADLDLEVIDEVRYQWPFLRDRRGEIYGELAAVCPNGPPADRALANPQASGSHGDLVSPAPDRM
ncbi:MAG: hypothetical protein HYY65_05715, partial [Candidatus Tectomicrobia bacterium]|nr:hypothetical protein [Candidatus Tectomicrobia bacterium]